MGILKKSKGVRHTVTQMEEEEKEAKKALAEAQRAILEKWKEEWKKGKNTEEEDYFFKLFESNYQFVCGKMKKNSRYNFTAKRLYLAVILFLPVLCLLAQIVSFLVQVGLGIHNKNIHMVSVNWLDNLLAITATIALSILLGAVVAKWIDIMKYQETWARHADHKYKLDREMYFFITDAGSYSDVRTKRRIFIERVFAIWDENNIKFVKNLEEKEKPLTDTLKIIRGDSD